MAETSKHEHDWRVLRVQIPWRPEHFDKTILGGERPRYEDGTPHTDEDFFAKVADPLPEVVLQCWSCKDTKAIEIPGNVYRALVDMLEAGEIIDDHTAPEGSELSTINLRDLIPELAAKIDKLNEHALLYTGSAKLRRLPDGTIERSGLSGKRARETETRSVHLPAHEVESA